MSLSALIFPFILSTTGTGVFVGVDVGTLVSVGMGELVSVGGGEVSVEADVAVAESTSSVGTEAGALHAVNTMMMNNVKKCFIFMVLILLQLFLYAQAEQMSYIFLLISI